MRATNPKSARRLGRVQSCTHMVMMGIRVAVDKVALDGRAVNELEMETGTRGSGSRSEGGARGSGRPSVDNRLDRSWRKAASTRGS